MKIVFMGTPDFAAGTLKTLIDSKNEVIAVVSQPDKPKGRGKAVLYTPVKEVALENNITVIQPEKARDREFIEKLKKLNPDIIVVVAFGQIIPKEILEMPKYGCINVHASLLPKYRGSAPIQWAVIDGEKETGVTIMRMDEGIDTGDMIAKAVVELDKKETGGSLFDKLRDVGAQLCLETLDKIENGTATYEKQDDGQSNYAKRLNKALGNIKWDMDAIEIERLIRGLNPWPSAYTSMEGKTMKIWDADVIEKDSDGTIGEIIEVTKDSICVKTGKGILAIKELQLEGKKRLKTDAFLCGFTVEEGIILK